MEECIMSRTLLRISGAGRTGGAVALLAGALLACGAAHAGAVGNGVNLNGVNLNGISINGVSVNGVSVNGHNMNGHNLNGTSIAGDGKSDAATTRAHDHGLDANRLRLRHLTLPASATRGI
jgi:uncharacterized protein YjbI with pentapeptide repeats